MPSGSDEAAPLNEHARFVQLGVNAATGGWLAGGGVELVAAAW